MTGLSWQCDSAVSPSQSETHPLRSPVRKKTKKRRPIPETEKVHAPKNSLTRDGVLEELSLSAREVSDEDKAKSALRQSM
jgi:hypothetical protein